MANRSEVDATQKASVSEQTHGMAPHYVMCSLVLLLRADDRARNDWSGSRQVRLQRRACLEASFAHGEGHAQLKNTFDAHALTEVARVHADLNRLGGLLKLAIRKRVSDRSGYHRWHLELADSVRQFRWAVDSLVSQP